MTPVIRFIAVSLLLFGGVFALPGAANAATVTVTGDYNVVRSTPFAPEKLLNANEGGYKTHNSLNWLPESYPTFKEAGLRMVAITHLLNENFYNVVSGTAPNYSYDFSKLDRVVLPLAEQGMTPLMGLAFTPEVLGGADKATGYSPAIPNNNENWKRVVQALVQHYRDLGYTGWYWEVWNEPDSGTFWAGSQAQYNAMYAATAQSVRAADPTAKVGGPTTTQGGWWFFDGFTAFLKANPDVPLDFASFHSYGPTPTFDLTDRAKSSLDAAGRTGVPIFLTEWNITHIFGPNPGTPSDTNADASYAARRLADAVDRPALSKVFWFSPKEGWLPTSLFSGDLGMLTVDGHRKAAFNTFALASQMPRAHFSVGASGPGTTDKSVGGIGTRGEGGKVGVLIWNDQASGTDFTLQLNHLPHAGKNVRVTQYLIDENHGNYYKDYTAGLRGWAVGPNELADPQESRIVAGASTFSRTLAVGPHSVVMYLLEPTDAEQTDAPQVGPAPIPVGSRNLAAGRPVTARSAVPWGWSTGALVDGLTHTFSKVDAGAQSNGWSSEGHAQDSATEWAYVDLGYSAALSRVKLYPRDDKECEGYGFPIDFAIEGSNDAAHWVELDRRTNYNNGQPLPVPSRVQTFAVSGTYRYVRVTGTRLQLGCAGVADTSRYLQLAELQVESDANLASGASVSASSSLGADGWSTAFVNDGVESSVGSAKGWSSERVVSADRAQDVTLSLPAATGISRVDLFPRDDPGNEGTGFPRAFTIQVAADPACSSWTTVAGQSAYPNPGKFRRTFGFAARTAKCVRVQGTDLFRFSDGLYGFQLGEIKLYH